MNDCEKYIEMISAMVDCELTEEQTLELRTHIDNCRECARVYDAFIGLSDVLADDLVSPPETLAKGVMYKIKLQKKGGADRHLAFGRYTAIAACLALIMLGASHFGLLDGFKTGSSSRAVAPEAAAEQNITEDSATVSPDAGSAASGGTADNSETEEVYKTSLTAGEPANECTDGTVLQFGFSTQNFTDESNNDTEEEKEPAFLFDAKELRVYDGKYYTDEKDKDKNNLLFTLTTEDDLSALSDMVAAMPDNAVEYSPDDGEILESDPLFTLYIPADKEKDVDAKDKIICLWFVKGELWCLVSDAEEPGAPADADIDSEKILYKAEGLQEKFETFVVEISKEKGIT